MCAVAVTVDRILRKTFTGTLYFFKIVGLYIVWHDAYVFNSVKGGTRLQLDTRLALEVLRYDKPCV